jgi:hypothetical protein
MTSSPFDARVEQLEGSLDKAESLLQSVDQVLRSVEKAQNRIGKGSRTPFLLVAASTLVGVAVVFIVARRQD